MKSKSSEEHQLATDKPSTLQQHAVLAELGRLALTRPDTRELLRRAAVSTAEALHVDYCHVFEFLPETQELLLKAAFGWPEEKIGRERISAPPGFANEDNVNVDGRALELSLLAGTDAASSLSVPIPGVHRAYGMLGVAADSRRDFTSEEASFLHSVANVLALAMKYAARSREFAAHDLRFYTLMESVPTAIIMTDDSGCIVMANRKTEEMFGYSQAELVGQRLDILLPERFRDVHRRHLQDFFSAPRIRSMGVGLDLTARRKDGTEFPVEVGLSHMTIDGNTLAISFVTDISLRKQAEHALQNQASELEQHVVERTREIERRRQAAEGLREILTILNSSRPLDDILSHILAQAEHLMGIHAAAIYKLRGEDGPLTVQVSRGLSSTFVTHLMIPLGWGAVGRAVLERKPIAIPDNAAIFADIVTDTNASAKPHLRARLVNHASRYRSVLSVPIVVKGAVYGGLSVYHLRPRAFTEEEIKLAVSLADHAALAIENARLREQAEKSAAAAERSRLARDLHDAVTQTLFSTSLIAEVLPRIWEKNTDEGKRRLSELRELTRGALAEMRTLLLELRPSALIEADLEDLLRQLAEAVTGRSRVPISVTISGKGQLPSEVRVALYRIAQEALNNVAKHANASEAQINLRFNPRDNEQPESRTWRVALEIIDNGTGFDASQSRPTHLGLKIMRERAESIDAELSITSSATDGTQVVVRWPGAHKSIRTRGVNEHD